MNPPSIEIVFLILSGVILLAGILYWFWSHLQLTQKKVQLLENAVFELRGMLTQRHESPDNGGGGSNNAPSPYTDLSDDEDWAAEEGSAASTSASASNVVEHVSTPLSALDATANTVTVIREGAEGVEALMPGGRVSHKEAEVEVEEKTVDLHELVKEEEQFRELFVGGAASTPDKKASSVGSNAEALESMPVKELRRLAEQRGIPGAAEMRKKEILSALRNQVGNNSTVEVERTMDLTEITEEMPVLE